MGLDFPVLVVGPTAAPVHLVSCGQHPAAHFALNLIMPIAPDIPAAETAIVELTNALRAEHALNTLTQSTQLAAAARAYAAKLARTDAFSHTVGGTTPSSRAKKAGYAYCQIAENLASLYDSRGFTARNYAKRAVQGWENSPGHLKNMLTPHVTEIGVAIARAPTPDAKYVAVQLFGRPRALQYTFKITNTTKSAVGYVFAGKNYVIQSRYTITHSSCKPGNILFSTSGMNALRARYEARDGEVYSLKPARAGGMSVELGLRTTAN